LRVVKGQNTFASSNQLKSSTLKTILLSPLFTIGAFFTVSLNAQNCNASFTYTVSGNTVYFNNTSDSGTYVMSWLFGDNITGMGNNPSHTYSGPGTYNVCLAIMNFNQQFCDSVCQTITISGNQNCTASFTYTMSGNTANFTNTSTAGTFVMAWYFGDSQTSFTNNPSHTYANAGTYNVCLIIMNQNQQFCDSTCQTIVVQPASISEQFNGTAITIAPNPATDFINVSFSATAGITTFEILDIAGRVVMTEQLTTSGSVVHAINVQSVPAGAYYVRLSSGSMVGGKRILISK